MDDGITACMQGRYVPYSVVDILVGGGGYGYEWGGTEDEGRAATHAEARCLFHINFLHALWQRPIEVV